VTLASTDKIREQLGIYIRPPREEAKRWITAAVRPARTGQTTLA
jgi:hypothetical protein